MLSPNKKLLAVAERAEKAVVSVYDMQTLKRRKQLVAADVGSKLRHLVTCAWRAVLHFSSSHLHWCCSTVWLSKKNLHCYLRFVLPRVLQEYVSLSFSPDGKMLLAQGGSPDWNLLLWAWEKSKVTFSAFSGRTSNMQNSPVVQVGCALFTQQDPKAQAQLVQVALVPPWQVSCRSTLNTLLRQLQQYMAALCFFCRPVSAQERVGW